MNNFSTYYNDIMFLITESYKKIKMGDYQNIIGFIIFIVAIFSDTCISKIFDVLIVCFLLYSIRENIVHNINKTLTHNNLICINYYWISLMSICLSYKLLWGLLNEFTNQYLTLIVNICYVTLLTTIINELLELTNKNEILTPINTYELQMLDNENVTKSTEYCVFFLSKLYIINKTLLDNIIMIQMRAIGYIFESINVCKRSIQNNIKNNYDNLITKTLNLVNVQIDKNRRNEAENLLNDNDSDLELYEELELLENK